MPSFRLPDVGEGLTEAEVVRWCVAPGDTVAVNDVLLEIETAKSVVELPSPFAGVVGELLVPEGRTVPVGTTLVSVDAVGDGPGPDAAEGGGRPESGRQAMLVGYGPREEGTPQRRRRRAPAGATATLEAPVEKAVVEKTVAGPVSPVARATRPMAKPPVRKLAKDLGVDLAQVPCDGLITRSDVEAFARDAGRPAEPAPAPNGDGAGTSGERRVPVTAVRRATAAAMVKSAFTAPHVTEWVQVDVTGTVELVDRLRADRAWRDVAVSPTLLVLRAVCLALRRTPELNAAWADDEIVMRDAVHLGVAAATDRGLVVPVVRDAQALDLRALSARTAELVATARAGTIQSAQMAGGTFTVTNVGVFGVDGGTPILPPGQTGILAVGAIARRPWVDEHDAVVPRWVTTLALSFDHRVVDGEQGSRFLTDVAALLREPGLALAW